MKYFNFKQSIQEEEYASPKDYNVLFNPEDKLLWQIARENRITKIKDLLKPYRGQRILDAGCGTGFFCYCLSGENVKITGVDYSKKAIAFAKAFNPKIKFIISDLASFRCPQKFNQIIFSETLEHIIPKDIPKTLAGLSRLLTVKGMMIITVPSVNLSLHSKHYQHFSKESLNKILAPYFKKTKIIGYADCTWKRKIFNVLRLVAYTLYPFRNKLLPVQKLYQFLNYYYDSQLSLGDPDKCFGLIAICSGPIYSQDAY